MKTADVSNRLEQVQKVLDDARRIVVIAQELNRKRLAARRSRKAKLEVTDKLQETLADLSGKLQRSVRHVCDARTEMVIESRQ
jgi:hypothetical protein